MSAATDESTCLVGQERGAAEAALVASLDRWIGGAPRLSRDAAALAAEENPRRRRVSFWEHLGEIEIPERSRLLEEILASAYREEKEGLRLLFTFLCGRPTTFLYPERIADLRHCRRFGRRLLFYDAPRTEEDTQWLESFQALLPRATDPAALDRELTACGKRLLASLCGKKGIDFPFPEDLEALIKLEGSAASLRGGRLVDQVGDYDPAALARLLPLVVALDEWQGDLHALADRGAPALKHPLEQFLGEEDTARWGRRLAKEETAASLLVANWIDWMGGMEMVGNEPAAWVALLTTLGERSYRRTVHAALLLPQRWRTRRLGLKKRPPAGLFAKRHVLEEDGLFWVDLDRLHWAEWVSPDGRPTSHELWTAEESPLLLLRSRVQDEAFCERILGNEAWTGRQGVVETIARGSRSLKILLRIARDRKLHAGASNRGVPLALLESPANIPLSALRPFLSLRHVTRHDLTRLSRGGPDVREELSREARAVMKYL